MLKKGDLVLAGAIIIVVIAVFSGMKIMNSYSAGTRRIAVIRQDGKVIKKVDLDKIQSPQHLDVSKDFYEVILIENGRIRFEVAHCPDQRCVKTGWLSEMGHTAVCLPNKTMITIIGDGDNKVDIGAY
jgi:hypothetical protein